MADNQRTIKKPFFLTGVGLHSGEKVDLNFRPADDNAGISFVRIDLPNQPVIKVVPENGLMEDSNIRCTSIGKDGVAIRTVEHLLSVLSSVGIDNLVVEINGDEIPGMDGSGLEFYKAIKASGIVEQESEKQFFSVKEPISVESNGSSLTIFPAKEFKVSYTMYYDHPFLGAQYFSSEINEDIFEKEIVSGRTFCLESEAAELRKRGLGKGANYKNTLVVGEDAVIDNELRYDDEFVRHKVMDLIGDLYLLGIPIKGHVFATKSGHALNLELLKKIAKQKKDCSKKAHQEVVDFDPENGMDIQQIMKILPHRYPFLLVDRIVELEKGKRAVAIKNVTMNEQFFQGHFPSRPLMPGVLMVEAMAQVGGVTVLTNEAHYGKVGLFMGVDKVKFRRVVVPGDQLVMEVEVTRDRSRTTQLKGVAKVNGDVVVEAEMMFSFTDISYLE